MCPKIVTTPHLLRRGNIDRRTASLRRACCL